MNVIDSHAEVTDTMIGVEPVAKKPTKPGYLAMSVPVEIWEPAKFVSDALHDGNMSAYVREAMAEKAEREMVRARRVVEQRLREMGQ